VDFTSKKSVECTRMTEANIDSSIDDDDVSDNSDDCSILRWYSWMSSSVEMKR